MEIIYFLSTISHIITRRLFLWYMHESTFRWSNFDRRDPKIGVFLQSTEATPCGHLLKCKLTPENPPTDTMFVTAMTMVLR